MTKSVTLPNSVTLEYVEQGKPSGLPVVLLHGVTDSWRSFEGVLPYVPTSVRAIAVSQRGHGGSSHPDGYRFADFSADLRMFLDALDIRAAVIVGHSMGSYVAQRFAVDHPERTLGLVLVGSFARLRGNPAVAELWDSNIATLTEPVDPQFILEFQKSTLAQPVSPAFLDMVVRESQKLPAWVWRDLFGHFLEADFSDELAGITAPTLVVWGDQDVISPRADQDALLQAIPHARLMVYEGGGHAIHWEDPARFAIDLMAFVHEVERGIGRAQLTAAEFTR